MAGSLFEIIGPVMVGPSSSHTAGAVRLANLARNLAGQPIAQAEFVLYNSFAKTYAGHGTDRGLLAGLLGYGVDDNRIRDVFDRVAETGLTYRITPYIRPNHYSPNTVVFHLTLADGETLTVVGHSVGGGKVYVSKINDYNVSLKGDAPTVVLFYKDQPGMIWKVTKVIAERHVNIASLQCSQRQRGVEAFMTICLDAPLLPEDVAAIRQIPDVYKVWCLEALPL